MYMISADNRGNVQGGFAGFNIDSDKANIDLFDEHGAVLYSSPYMTPRA